MLTRIILNMFLKFIILIVKYFTVELQLYNVISGFKIVLLICIPETI